ncbi:Elicitin [Phytophthora megakarya]|uniref:Elicitin n=1 Tax=Phytophthora megakarya TaxID=4795 RepID=A0A225WWB1_9STRA|nr:Elicitin [Phytophthora megakarya]
MKFLLIGAVAAALVQTTSADSCAIATLAKILTNQYIDQCATDSGYVFTSGAQPTPAQVAGMCASDACHSLLADVQAMGLTECTLPIGTGIYLFADLIDYVSDQCAADTPQPTTAAPEPTTTAPTPVPTTAAPTPTATPAPTTALASCTSAQLRYLLTSSYEAQCVTDTGYPFTAPYSPTDAQVAAMYAQVTALCASESCVNLFAYVSSMVTTDCRIPVGGKILLLADLVDYVSDQCVAETPSPTTENPAPTTAAPTPEPSTATPVPTATTAPVATCATKVISSLLTDPYIDQCADDSGYAFTSGIQPTPEEVAGMCGSTACANLLADVEALGLSECILPIGNKIYLFRDLVDYVADQCSGSTTPSPETPGTTAPSSEPPITESPGTESPGTESPTPSSDSPGTPIPGTDSPITAAPGTEPPTTSTPTETPEPTTPNHDWC